MIGPPRSSAGMPRTMPSVGCMRNAAHAAFAEMLLHFDNDVDRRRDVESLARDVGAPCGSAAVAFRKFHVQLLVR